MHHLLVQINLTLGIEYYQYPSSVIILAAFVSLIDKYLWKWKLFSWLYWIPVLEGRYEGYIEFSRSRNTQTMKRQFTLEIEQTGSQLSIKAFHYDEEFRLVCLASKTQTVIKEGINSNSLVVTYTSNGNNPKVPHHNGTIELAINAIKNSRGKEVTFLDGIFYNDKTAHYRGEISCKFVTKKLKRKIE